MRLRGGRSRPGPQEASCPASDSINRRQFLEKSSLDRRGGRGRGRRPGGERPAQQLGRGEPQAGAAGLHRRRDPRHAPHGGGRRHRRGRDQGRRRLLQGAPRRRPRADQPRPRSHRRLQGDPLPPRRRRRGDRDARPLAPADDAGGARGRQARLHREADDPPLGGRRGLHRGRREEREGAAGGQPVHEHGRRAEGGRLHPERAAGAGHPRRGPLPPQHRDRRLVLPDPARRLADDGGLQELPRLRRAPRLRPPPLLPVAPLLGLLGRPAHRPLRAHRHRHPPAHGRLGAGERLQLRRHLPLEELPRGARTR